METRASRSEEITKREKDNTKLAYEIAAEGMVLLENDGVLPLEPGKIALYGAGSSYTVYGGSGSGEVNSRHNVSVLEGLLRYGFDVITADWINRYDALWNQGKVEFIRSNRKKLLQFSVKVLADLMAAEYTLPSGDRLSEEEVGKPDTDTCIYVVARQSGEGHDRKDEAGNFRLDETELANIQLCSKHFRKFILVINTGCIIDLSPLQDIEGINAVVYMGQSGMESGNALAALLCGEETFSGKLSVSWPKSYEDVPFHEEYGVYGNGDAYYKEGIYTGYRYYDTFHKEVLYPFGYGLSYTEFVISEEKASLEEGDVIVTCKVKNKGKTSFGKQTVQVYVSLPEGKIDSEYQRLTAFAKTRELFPGEEEEVSLCFPLKALSVYDEERALTLLKEGEYILRLGDSSRNTLPIAKLLVEEEIVLSRHRNLCVPSEKISCLVKEKRKDEDLDLPVWKVDKDLYSCKEYDYEEKEEVFSKKTEEYLDSFHKEDYAKFCAGTGLFGEDRGFRTPGAVGHTTTDYLDRGIPNVELCDGPAGLRLQRRSLLDKKGKINAIDVSISLYEFLPGIIRRFLLGDPKKGEVLYQYVTGFPTAAVLAMTWNDDLAYQMGEAVGKEMEEYGTTYWLAPAMNIVRNPLCGRNYEYYSEDPVVSGIFASALIRGVQKKEGLYTTIKHFAANNQETERYTTSSNLDERTLREIYLKGFEIAVKEAKPKALMSAYNKINGVYSANNKDLLTDILRKEWGYEGIVMTDWLSTGEGRASEAGCMEAGVDLIMPGGKKVVKKLLEETEKGNIKEKELRSHAGRVIDQFLHARR